MYAVRRLQSCRDNRNWPREGEKIVPVNQWAGGIGEQLVVSPNHALKRLIIVFQPLVGVCRRRGRPLMPLPSQS